MLNVKIINQSHHPLPSYSTQESAGMDIRAYLPDGPVRLEMLDRMAIPTGLFIQLPKGYEAQIRPRSGMALKQGLSMANTPGTIDSDYRGEIKAIVINLSREPITISDGDRIGQIVIAKYEVVEWQPTEVLDDTDRGEGGFGSTGKN